ncbi:MAG: calcium-binding protein, partial [Rhizobiales bacterium]|nr:calcium-binding protein [Hyphomicrobiales bacterium]
MSSRALRGVFWCEGGKNDKYFVGGPEGDKFWSEGGKDSLFGGAGDDSFIQQGFSSDDLIDGGAGYDSLYLDFQLSGTMVLGGQNIRNVEWLGISGSLTDLTIIAGDSLVSAGSQLSLVYETGGLASHSLDFDGSAEKDGRFEITVKMGDTDDVLRGGAGNDTFHADSGNDILVGNLGDDTLDGGGGEDTAVFRFSRAAYEVDWIAPGKFRIVGHEGIDFTDSIEFFQFSTGTSTAAELAGLTVGPDGAYASINNAARLPAAMTDAVQGGLIRLAPDYSNETALVTVEDLTFDADATTTGIVLQLGAGITFIALAGLGTMNVTGNELDNTIVGNDGNNFIDGGAGADIMIGGRGQDTFVVDDIGDVVIGRDSYGIVLDDAVLSSISYSLNMSIRKLTLTGSTAINGSGYYYGGSPDSITGNDGNNILRGFGGDDTLSGGLGNDVLDGMWGKDTASGGQGDDTFYVGQPDDVVIELA